MADEQDLDVLAAYVVLADEAEKKKTKRSIWTKEWLLKRGQLGHATLFDELRPYPDEVHTFLRMEEEVYADLLKLVGPKIERQTTRFRTPISAHERLMVTLRYLATGANYQDLKFASCISPQSLSCIIPDTCAAIYQVLAPDYLKFPSSEDEWLQIAQGFESQWQFPNCLGAVDGKHIAISPPPKSGSYFFNYKGFNSMVLLAVANANYELVYVNFGTNGRVSDGGVIEQTDFYTKLKQGGLHLPKVNTLNGLPYVFVGDEAFALRPDFLKPYNIRVLDDQKRIFNYRLSRARRIVENVFGILVSRFGVLRSEIKLKPENIDYVVLACCALHNYLRKQALTSYSARDVLDEEEPSTHVLQEGLRATGPNIADISPSQTKNASEEAKSIRNKYTVYFNTVGKVSWQDRLALVTDK